MTPTLLLPLVSSLIFFQSACSTPDVPENVLLAGDAVQWLWLKAQEGIFYKWLPGQFEHVEPAWTDFMHNEALPIIDSFYA